MTSKLQTVHVRVNDAATGQPTPVRIRFTDADGNYHAPLGRLADFATGRNQDVGGNVRLGMQAWAYVDGSFEINLPPGSIQVKITKGPEYRPVEQTLQLKSGKLALRFTIERWIDLPARGWISGDGRVHHLTPHAALLEAQAEDVHVLNLLAGPTEITVGGDKKPALANILAFSGQQPALQAPGYAVVVNTHNTHPVLGSLGLLNCHRVVYPLEFGGSDGKDDWTFAAWCDQCHRKNGLVVWTRTWHENTDFFMGEPLVDLLLGKVDAFEIDHFEDSPFDVLPSWYDLLNAGLKVPLLGSSGKESNASAVGVMRTYAALEAGASFSYPAWIEAVRAGRVFISNGPALFLTVNDLGPGSELSFDQPETLVHVRAAAESPLPLQSLEILVNGEVLAATEGNVLELDLPCGAGGWVAARCRGAQQIFDRPANQKLFAHTAPVTIRLGQSTPPKDGGAVARLLANIDRMEAWVKHKARAEEAERGRFIALVRDARKVLMQQI